VQNNLGKHSRVTIAGDEINLDRLREVTGDKPTYEMLMKHFHIPPQKYFNMATDTVDKNAGGSASDRIALICDRDDRSQVTYSYQDLAALSNNLASFLQKKGVGKGDVVACFAGQGIESAMAHLAAYKIGAIVAPLSQLYGPEAVRHVLQDCNPRVIVTEQLLWERIATTVEDIGIELAIISDNKEITKNRLDFQSILDIPASRDFVSAKTSVNDPALLLYTSGSTGMPKGILHRQGLLRGYLSSVSLFYEMHMNEEGQRLWTISDWSWVAGIFNVMLTGWYFGHAVVAGDQKFTPSWTFSFLEKHSISHCFLTPTALKRLAETKDPRGAWPGIALRAIGTGGEPLPAAVLEWGQRELGAPINEFYGLTEVNHLIGNCSRLWSIKPGSMGRAYPGHTITVLDENRVPVKDGVVGEIAARQDDPTLFIEYWQNESRTRAIQHGEWILTGDYGYRDEDGYFWYKGREDDLIKSAGYRIGPAEIEDALVSHPEVVEAAVIGVPDEDRGHAIKAFVSLSNPENASDQLVTELQNHVKTTLAYFKYPRIVEFVNQFPLTSTGKINRKELRRQENAQWN